MCFVHVHHHDLRKKKRARLKLLQNDIFNASMSVGLEYMKVSKGSTRHDALLLWVFTYVLVFAGVV